MEERHLLLHLVVEELLPEVLLAMCVGHKLVVCTLRVRFLLENLLDDLWRKLQGYLHPGHISLSEMECSSHCCSCRQSNMPAEVLRTRWQTCLVAARVNVLFNHGIAETRLLPAVHVILRLLP